MYISLTYIILVRCTVINTSTIAYFTVYRKPLLTH